jgi:hypothetical protein
MDVNSKTITIGLFLAGILITLGLGVVPYASDNVKNRDSSTSFSSDSTEPAYHNNGGTKHKKTKTKAKSKKK